MDNHILNSETAGEPAREPLGKPDCPVCRGSGWEVYTRTIEIPSVKPYEAEFARPCKCRIGGAA